MAILTTSFYFSVVTGNFVPLIGESLDNTDALHGFFNNLPYLIRRAEENTSVAGQTSRELTLIKTERNRRKGK